MGPPVRIAFVKFGGLAASGTERWLQMMAANLPPDRFAVDYYYCDAAPLLGSDLIHATTDPDRLAFMEAAGVNLIKFNVGAMDVSTPRNRWIDTDFWDVFDQARYRLVQTAKAGPAEYPYDVLDVPVVEYVTLNAGVDHSSNVVCTILLSQWQRRQWIAAGGDFRRSDVLPIPAERPVSSADLRAELGLPERAVVMGFHQRAQDAIFSPWPLEAFARVARPDQYFVLMGGGSAYRSQAAALGLDNVLFIEHSGSAERISAFLNTLDLFVHGRADGETFGTVFAEAMMHGLPCMSHRSEVANAQPETMGPAGLFAQDEEDYVRKLQRLLEDGALRDRLAAKARPHAERYYTVGSCVRRLMDVYDGLLLDRPPSSRGPLPYGRSELGFLVAGRLDDPASAAHHVLTGRIPDEPAADLVRHVVAPADAYCEVGGANTLLAFAVAQAAERSAPAHLYARSGESVGAAVATVDLNNWEDRLTIATVDGPEGVSDDALRDARILVVNDADWVAPILERLLQQPDTCPALLLRTHRQDVEPFRDRLDGRHALSVRRSGLARRQVRGSEWLLCVDPARDAVILDRLSSWVAHRQRLRSERIRTWPRRAAARLRMRAATAAYAALGDRAHQLRRALPF
jgi:hypothetical protein